MSDFGSFANKVALITGSSAGIGAECAVQLAKRGCHVTITGRNAVRLEQVKMKCEEAGGNNVKVLSLVGDVTNSEFVAKLVDSTVKTLGAIDILINNAGGSGAVSDWQKAGSVEQSVMGDYDGFMNLNARSVVEITKLCIPSLKQTKGNVVNISSVASTVPVFGYYGMAKAALDYFTKMLAHELGPAGVRVNAVNPGAIKTNILVAARGFNEEQVDQIYEQFRERSLYNEYGVPKDISDAVLYLAGDTGRFVTGHCLVVDGGSLIKGQFGSRSEMIDKVKEQN